MNQSALFWSVLPFQGLLIFLLSLAVVAVCGCGCLFVTAVVCIMHEHDGKNLMMHAGVIIKQLFYVFRIQSS
jgi:hypothetical protein